MTQDVNGQGNIEGYKFPHSFGKRYNQEQISVFQKLIRR